jgi:thiol-disulfide isomerase/thioredoxin
MKNLFINVILFVALSVIFSGCPSASTQKGPYPTNDVEPNTTEKKDNKVFPPPPAAIAQAEYKMLDGSTFKLEDKKGKVVLFNLWGIWCPPCIAEMPHLIEMQEKYKDKNFEIIGLNVGDGDGNTESAEAIKAFVEKKKLNYQIGYIDRPLFEEFTSVAKMAGVPISVLINRDGKMTNVFAGGGPRLIEQMKQAVDKTVSE